MGCADFNRDEVLNLDDARIYLAWNFVNRFVPDPPFLYVQSYIDAQIDAGVWPAGIEIKRSPEVPDADFEGDGNLNLNDVRIYIAWNFVKSFILEPTIELVQAYCDSQSAVGIWPDITVSSLPELCPNSSSSSSSLSSDSSASSKSSSSQSNSSSSQSNSSSSQSNSSSSQSESSSSESNSSSSQSNSSSSQSNSSSSQSNSSSSQSNSSSCLIES